MPRWRGGEAFQRKAEQINKATGQISEWLAQSTPLAAATVNPTDSQ